ncbi:MAG TPA: ATP-binding protein [Bacteroidales bacterium]|jgi:nitrogen fixation/metabolism regulation signal transduction histidine kinase|nr:ATP-binding protein [Bacteroidales bacterium]
MVFKNYRYNIIFRVVLLGLTIFLFFWSIYGKEDPLLVAPVIVAVIIILQAASMIRYLDKTNRELTSFLQSIRFAEFQSTFQIEGMGGTYNELNKAFNEVMQDFQKVRAEKEESFHYLQTIVQNIDVSVIAYSADGNIELINKTAKKLFQMSSIRNIKSLEPLSAELVHTLLTIKPGENKLVKVQYDDDFLQLAIYGSTIKVKDKLIYLVTIKDIQNVLEEQETEAWQKLIRVLTHEIMNSITPIASLSSTLDLMLKGIVGDNHATDLKIDRESVGEIQEALQTINKRSTGLLHFVNTYRNLTRIPKPDFKLCSVKELFENIVKLMEDEISKNNIQFIVNVEPESLEFTADDKLIEQVLINLIKNAIHALNDQADARIQLLAFMNKRGRITLQVIDNGPGILKDVLDKIFIPFFTTKPSGSGIGLSLSKQILRLHNATITAHSEPGVETVFTMTF